MQKFKWLQMVILCVGSLIVIYIGISLLRAKTQDLEKDAHATPVINGVSCPAANVTWKAPSIIVPSMIACGLNQVTTQADEMVFLMDMVG